MKFSIICMLLTILISTSYSQKKAPNFILDDIDGKKIELTSFSGKGPVLLSFWATWCKPCVEEMAEYKKIYEELKNKGFTLLAVSIDDAKTSARVKSFIKSRGYDFTVLLDSKSEAAEKFQVEGKVPYNVLLDKNLNIVFTHEGYVKGDELLIKKKLESLLNKK